MSIKDEALFKKIAIIRDHYQNNINNRFLRKAFLMLKLPRENRENLERFMEEADFYKIQGYRFQELYEQIYAVARFVYQVKKEVLPNLKSYLYTRPDSLFAKQSSDAARDRILREMAIDNFPTNLSALADMINELYVMTVNMDKEEQPKKPVFEHLPELKEIGRLLT